MIARIEGSLGELESPLKEAVAAALTARGWQVDTQVGVSGFRIDVYPEQYPQNWELAGYELMVSNEVFRGRFRGGFEKPEAIVPQAVREYAFSLHTQDYTFLKGHRLMVQVQSSWFPIIDRNPQTFVTNIFQAKPEDFRSAHTTDLPLRSRAFSRHAPGRRSASVIRVASRASMNDGLAAPAVYARAAWRTSTSTAR